MDDWVSANELWSAGIEEHGFGFNEIVCARAEAGLIKAKAARVIIVVDDEPDALNDVELPAGFWWANGRDPMVQNWETGDFSCLYAESGSRWDNHKIYHLNKWSWPLDQMRVAAFDVQFDRQGASSLCPQLDPQPEPIGKQLSSADERKLYDALRCVRDRWTEQEAQLALAGLFPGNSIARDRLRQGLEDSGLRIGRGRPPNSRKNDPAN